MERNDKLRRRRLSIEEAMAKIEAALYVSGRPLAPKELAKAAGITSERKAVAMARELANAFRSNLRTIEIAELEGGKFVLQLRRQYAQIARKFASRPLISSAGLRTLSYIAYYQPISYTELANRRGKRVYKYLKELESRDFVSAETSGRTRLYRTTKTFADYFGISPDLQKMKEQLRVGMNDVPSKADGGKPHPHG